jgi:hypothetical protein
MRKSRKCEARTRHGRRCRAWAVRGIDPPRCAAHRQPPPRGTPEAAPGLRPNLAGENPGGLDLDPEAVLGFALAGLMDKLLKLDDMIDACPDDNRHQARLVQIYAQSCSRLGRLLRDRRALSGEAANGISAAVGTVLDELGTELTPEIEP